MCSALLADVGVAATAPSQILLSAPFITGSHYKAQQLMPIYVGHLGQPVSAERIAAITRELEALYERDGYVLPLIVVQNERSETPDVHVFEARVAEIIVRGDAGPHREAVERLAARLQAESSLHKGRTQQVLRSIEALPGLALRAAFEPRPSSPHAYDLVLNVRFKAVNANADFSNRGTQDIGRNVMSGRLELNGLLGRQESLTLSAASATALDRYNYLSGRAERRFGSIDVDLAASRTRAHTEPDSFYRAERLTLGARTVVWATDALRIEPLAAISARDAADRDSGGDAYSVTRTRTLEGGVRLIGRGSNNSTRVQTSLVRGLDGWGADSQRRYGDLPDLAFSKGVLELSHARTLRPGWQLRAEFDGQWTGADLPQGERFTFGGARFGRAFDPADLIGDSGAAVSMQIDHYRQWENSWLSYARAFLQADYGVGWNNESASRARDQAASLSVGIGGRILAALGTFELSYPLDRPTDSLTLNKDLRAFFSMQVNF